MSIKAKIQKIIAKANSTTHEAEASALMAKAEAMMLEHQIHAYELGDDSDPVGMTFGVNGQSGPVAYKTHLQRALAAYYGCRAIRQWLDNKKWRLELVGAESARITTELMTDFVWKQVNDEARALAKEEGLKPGPVQRRIINALVARIYREAEEKKASDRVAVNNETAKKNALAVVNAVDAWVDEHYSGLKMSKGSKRSTSAKAREAAGRVSLHRQTTGSKTLRIGK